MSSQVIRFLLFFLSALLIPSFAWGAKKKEAKMSPPPKFETTYTKKQFKKKVKSLKRIERKIAKADNRTESLLSEEARTIRDHIIGGTIKENGKDVKVEAIKTAAVLDGKLKNIVDKFNAGEYKEDDAKLLAAQLNVLETLQGFGYRARNIFESNGKSRLAQSVVVTAMRATVAGIDTYLPTEQWAAGFDYFVKPFYVSERRKQLDCARGGDKSWIRTCDINNGAEYQKWLRLELLPRLIQLSDTIHEIANKTNPVVYFDNKIMYGTANFTHSRDRFIRLGKAELYLMLSGTQAMISGIYGINAYKLDGFFESFDTVAKIYGFRNFGFDAGRAQAKDRFKAIRSHIEGDGLFTLKKDQSVSNYMSNSYESLKASLQNSYYAWTLLRRDSAADRENLIDPRVVIPFNRILNAGFNNAFGIAGINQANGSEIAEGEVVSAVVAGEKVVVKLKNFYTNPPESLAMFMPKKGKAGFKPKAPRSELKGYGAGANVSQVRDYREGNPNSWNVENFKPYFGNVNSDEDIRRIARVLAQSWGGFFLGIPLAGVMM